LPKGRIRVTVKITTANRYILIDPFCKKCPGTRVGNRVDIVPHAGKSPKHCIETPVFIQWEDYLSIVPQLKVGLEGCLRLSMKSYENAQTTRTK